MTEPPSNAPPTSGEGTPATAEERSAPAFREDQELRGAPEPAQPGPSAQTAEGGRRGGRLGRASRWPRRTLFSLVMASTAAVSTLVAGWQCIERRTYDFAKDQYASRLALCDDQLKGCEKKLASSKEAPHTLVSSYPDGGCADGSGERCLPQELFTVLRLPPPRPSELEQSRSNGHIQVYVDKNPLIPPGLRWREFSKGAVVVGPDVHEFDSAKPNHFLFYKSDLFTEHDSWTGLLIWWRGASVALNGAGQSVFVLVAEALQSDVLELGFKDAHGSEYKIGMPVEKGWWAYRVPFSRFNEVDFNKIQLIILAHTRGRGSRTNNQFRIAHIGTM